MGISTFKNTVSTMLYFPLVSLVVAECETEAEIVDGVWLVELGFRRARVNAESLKAFIVNAADEADYAQRKAIYAYRETLRDRWRANCDYDETDHYGSWT